MRDVLGKANTSLFFKGGSLLWRLVGTWNSYLGPREGFGGGCLVCEREREVVARSLAPRCSILVVLRKEQGSRDGRCCRGTRSQLFENISSWVCFLFF